MAAKIKLKKSSVSSNAPGTGDLDYGELAINYADGRLYYKNSSNVIKNFIDSDLLQATLSGVGGTGTVTSVAATVPTGFTVAGSPITSSGTLAVSYAAGYQGYTTTEASKLAGIEAGADVTDTANVTAAGAAMTSGATMTGDLSFGDNVKVTFGDSANSALYFDGTNTYLEGTGELFFDGLTGVTIDGNNVTNQQTLLLSNMGAGVTGIQMSRATGGSLYYGQSMDHSRPIAVSGVNKSLGFNVAGSLGNASYAAFDFNIDANAANQHPAVMGVRSANSNALLFQAEQSDSTVVFSIDYSGNVALSGTVDGRDIATDGTKLDGIEAGATADQTASEILTAIKTVDGAASGLDADLLDGQHGSYYAPLASPALTGTPTAPTAAAGTNTTQIATTAFVGTAVSNLVDAAPTTLDTLNELAAALGDDPNFATTVSTNIGTKVAKAGDTMTGALNFGDNVKAQFGASADLQIYHNGTHSYITDAGTGDLKILAQNNIELADLANNLYFKGTDGGAATIYYNGSAKLATTSTGVDVTGKATANRFTPTDVISSSEVTFGVYASGAWLNSPSGTFGYLGTAGSGILRWGASDVTITGNVGIGTTSPSTDLHVYGSASGQTATNVNGIFVENSGSSNSYYVLQTATAGGGKSFSVTNAGNVGIGTTAPEYKLDVAGDIAIDNGGAIIGKNTTGGDTQLLYWSATSGIAYYGRNTPGGAVTQHEFRTGGTTRLTINSSGSVGIGTTSPQDPLHVTGDIRVDNAGYIVSETTTGGAVRMLGINPSDVAYVGPIDGGPTSTIFNASSTSNTAAFYTGGAERLRITSLGRVGIGTSSPSQELHVYGSNATAFIDAATGTSYPALSIGGSGTPQFSIDVDLGAPTTNGTLIRTQGGAYPLRFGTNTTERLRITSSGNVGIGTTSPGVPLDVNGTARATTFRLTNTGVLEDATATTTATTQVAIDQWSASAYGGGKLIIEAKDGVNRHIVELLVTHDGTTAIATEYGATYTSGVLATYDVDISGGNVRILATPASTNSTAFKIMRTTMFA